MLYFQLEQISSSQKLAQFLQSESAHSNVLKANPCVEECLYFQRKQSFTLVEESDTERTDRQDQNHLLNYSDDNSNNVSCNDLFQKEQTQFKSCALIYNNIKDTHKVNTQKKQIFLNHKKGKKKEKKQNKTNIRRTNTQSILISKFPKKIKKKIKNKKKLKNSIIFKTKAIKNLDNIQTSINQDDLDEFQQRKKRSQMKLNSKIQKLNKYWKNKSPLSPKIFSVLKQKNKTRKIEEHVDLSKKLLQLHSIFEQFKKKANLKTIPLV